MENKLQITEVESFESWACSSCEKAVKAKFEILHHDTLSINAAGLSDRLHALYLEVSCPECPTPTYLIEVNLISDSLKGREFIADNCWKAQSTTKYIAQTEHLRWDFELQSVVRFDDGREVSWIARHYFGLFDDLNTGRCIVENSLSELPSISGSVR